MVAFRVIEQSQGWCAVGSVSVWIVACEACDLRWNRVGNLTEYERQAIESQPCPICGSYTLSCRVPGLPKDKNQFRQISHLRRAA
jgi:rRNA maturation endonuclease Nob1